MKNIYSSFKTKKTLWFISFLVAALPFNTDAQLTRTQIINNAAAFTTFSWTASNCNLWNGTSCGGANVYKAPWITSAGTKTSMPYSWGGWSTISEYNTAMTGCKSAGQVCSSAGGGCAGFPSAPLSCAGGHDCSGLVSRAWGLSTKYSTSTLPNISTSIPLTSTQPGDILNDAGSHVRLVETNYGNGNYQVIEASGADWKTAYHTYTTANLSGYEPRCPDPGVVDGGCSFLAPVNDNCSGAITFPTLQPGLCIGVSSGQTVSAATQSLAPAQCTGCNCTSTAAMDVWFKFTAINTEHTIQLISSSGFDAVIEIRKGPSCNGTFLQCYDPSGILTQILYTYYNFIVGQVYYIRVFDFGSTPPTDPNFDICVASPASSNCIITSINPDSENHNPEPFSTTPGSDDIILNGQPNCTFTITGGCSWFHPTPLSGTMNSNGQAFMNYSIDANPSTNDRECTVYVNGSPFTAYQNGCTNEFSPSTKNVSLSGTTYNLDVDSYSPCSWSINNNCPWVHLSQSSSTGNQTISVTVDPNTSCNSQTCTLTISPGNSTHVITQQGNLVPAQPSTISGLTNVCQGANGVAYSVTNVSGVNYSWTYSGTGTNITAGSGTSSITVTYSSSATSGIWTVTPGNSCGNGTSRTLAVSVSSIPSQPGTITGPVGPCQNSTGNVYSVTNVSGVNYSWAYSGTGATITAGSGTSSITVAYSSSATSGIWTVTPGNTCGNGTPRTLSINLTQLPSQAGTITGSSSVCQGAANVAYSVPTIANATSYVWAYSGSGATITGTTNSITISFSSSATSGNLAVKGSNTCGFGTISANYPVTVNSIPAAAGTITGSSTVCKGANNVAYSVPTIANASSYVWEYSGTGATISGNTRSITISFSSNATGGNLTVKGSNTCGYGNISSIFPVNVTSLPIVTCPADLKKCVDWDPVTLSGGDPVGGVYTGVGVDMGVFYPAIAGVGPHTITYTYIDFNGCVNSCTFVITVNPLPVLTCACVMAVCIDANAFELTCADPVGGEYTGNGVFAGYFNPFDAGLGTHTITYTYQDANFCIISCTFTITVHDVPVVTCPATILVCETAAAFALTGATPVGGVYSGDGVSGGMFDPSAAGAGDHTILYTYTDGFGCVNSCEFTITVTSLPIILPIDDDVLLCDDFYMEVPLPYHINSTAAGYDHLLWSTTGTGSFDFDDVEDPIYQFSGQDMLAGTVTFTLTAYPLTTCSDVVTESFTVQLPSQLIYISEAECGISSFLDLSSHSVAEILEPFVDKLIQVENQQGQIYNPSLGINELGNWESVGYKASFTQPVCLPLFGEPVTNQIINIVPGENYLPVLYPIPIKIGELLGSDSTKVTYIYDFVTAQIWSPTFGPFNTLFYLLPGVAYGCLTSESFTIIYPPINGLPRLYFLTDTAYLCKDNTSGYLLEDVRAFNYSSIQWFTSGTGAFTQPGILKPGYIPSQADYTAGFVNIWAKIQNQAGDFDQDTLVLYFVPLPVANAGSDNSVSGFQYQLQGVVNHDCEILWNTSGDGYFDDPALPNPVYYFGDADYLTGLVELCVTAQGCNSCGEVTDCMTLNIAPKYITLNPGWNLISLDVIPNPSTPESVFAPLIAENNLEIVTGFQNQQGVMFDPAGLPFLNSLQNIVPGEGYWVKVTNAATLSVSGESMASSFTINLKTGWNLVGYWPNASSAPDTAFEDLMDAGVLDIVTGYDEGGQIFDPSGLPFLNTLTEIRNGFGYWVKLSEDYNGFSYPLSWDCGDLLIDDRDGKTYETVLIGPQCWMKQNMNIGQQVNFPDMQTDNGIFEKHCFNNDPINCDIYGGLYQWDEMMQFTYNERAQGICPQGWHIPSDTEFGRLITYVGSEAGGSMKEQGTSHWLAPNTGATNSSGFTALPGGAELIGTGFTDLGSSAYFWTSSNQYNYQFPYWRLYYNDTYIDHQVLAYLQSSLSVRCILDSNQPPEAPSNPSPTGNGVSINPTLTWTCSDPEGDPLTYDVFLLIDGSMQLVASGLVSPEYSPDALNYSSYYNWQVIAYDNHMNSTYSETWEFWTINILPSISTTAVTNITATTATCGGNVGAQGGSPVTARGVCWSTSVNPTTANNKTADGSGTGTFISTITGLTAGTTCYLRAYATNSGGTAYGSQRSFTTLFQCGANFTDSRDGKVYTTIPIGVQCWMKQNLNVGTRIEGTASQTNNGTIEKYCYNNLESNCDIYGGLYQWDEMMQYSTIEGVQGICPTGWHLPTDAEWTALTTFVSSQPLYLCNSNTSYIAKALAATTNWSASTNTCAVGNNLTANNATGFSGLPAGYCSSGSFNSQGASAYFWSATQGGSSGSLGRFLGYGYGTLGHSNYYQSNGFPVRCLKD